MPRLHTAHLLGRLQRLGLPALLAFVRSGAGLPSAKRVASVVYPACWRLP